MEFKWGNVVDVSPFVLVEATGDTDAVDHDSTAVEFVSSAEDDAESGVSDTCGPGEGNSSWDHDNVEGAEYSIVEETKGALGLRRSVFYHDSARVRVDFDDDDDDDGEVSSVVIDRRRKKKRRNEEMGGFPFWSCAPESAQATVRKRRRGGGAAIVESNKESLNEMERNRLFWESCLAS